MQHLRQFLDGDDADVALRALLFDVVDGDAPKPREEAQLGLVEIHALARRPKSLGQPGSSGGRWTFADHDALLSQPRRESELRDFSTRVTRKIAKWLLIYN